MQLEGGDALLESSVAEEGVEGLAVLSEEPVVQTASSSSPPGGAGLVFDGVPAEWKDDGVPPPPPPPPREAVDAGAALPLSPPPAGSLDDSSVSSLRAAAPSRYDTLIGEAGSYDETDGGGGGGDHSDGNVVVVVGGGGGDHSDDGMDDGLEFGFGDTIGDTGGQMGRMTRLLSEEDTEWKGSDGDDFLTGFGNVVDHDGAGAAVDVDQGVHAPTEGGANNDDDDGGGGGGGGGDGGGGGGGGDGDADSIVGFGEVPVFDMTVEAPRDESPPPPPPPPPPDDDSSVGVGAGEATAGAGVLLPTKHSAMAGVHEEFSDYVEMARISELPPPTVQPTPPTPPPPAQQQQQQQQQAARGAASTAGSGNGGSGLELGVSNRPPMNKDAASAVLAWGASVAAETPEHLPGTVGQYCVAVLFRRCCCRSPCDFCLPVRLPAWLASSHHARTQYNLLNSPPPRSFLSFPFLSLPG